MDNSHSFWGVLCALMVMVHLSSCGFGDKGNVSQANVKPGIVVVLNGTSSCGKTTIMNELIKDGGDYEVLSVDAFWGEYTKTHPTKELDDLAKIAPTDKKIEEKLNKMAEEYIRGLTDGFDTKIRDEALKGKKVLVDTVMADKWEFEKLVRILGNVRSVTILLYCPLDVTLARLKQRSLAGDERDARLPIDQYPRIYKPQENASETVVDIIAAPDIKALLKKTMDEYIKALPEEEKSRSGVIAGVLEADYKKFVETFGLDTHEQVKVVPRLSYDLILDCKKSPKELANEIADLIGKQNQ